MNDADLSDLEDELRSEKLQTRNKAFNKLDMILNQRLDELQKLLSTDEDRDCSWESLFLAVHVGITSHARKLNPEMQPNDSKISGYSKVIRKLCDAPNDGKFAENPPVAYMIAHIPLQNAMQFLTRPL